MIIEEKVDYYDLEHDGESLDDESCQPYQCNGTHDYLLCNVNTCPSLKTYLETEIAKINENTKNIRHQKTIASLKKDAFELTPVNLTEFECNQSNDCCNAGRCIKDTSFDSFVLAQMAFWGEKIISTDMGRKEFNNKISEVFKTAKFDNGKVVFLISPNRYICERAILLGLGLSTNPHLSRAPSQWIKAKNSFVVNNLSSEARDDYLAKERVERAQKVTKGTATTKLDSCLTFIYDSIAEFTGDEGSIADTTSYATTENDDDPPPKYIPYTDIKSFYDEYVIFTETVNCPFDVASISTFGRAWNSVKHVKLLGSKGAFKTCDFCSNCHDFLKNRNRRWTKEMIDLVLKIKRNHIAQQQRARLKLASDIHLAKQLDSKTGQPIRAFIEPDGVSTWLGNCPKCGKGAQSGMSQEEKIINRTIGVDFVCGPVEGKMVFHTDNFVPHGANVMVEVMRQSLQSLSQILADLKDENGNPAPLKLPRIFNWQFDNSRENKNWVILTYAHLLIENGYCDEIYITFLIVGHTHTRLDQYFSVLSTAVKNVDFIGSPLALHYLYQNCHRSSLKKRSDPPWINKQINIWYDVSTLWEPYRKKVTNIAVPHCFKLSKIHGVVALWTKNFTEYTQWLPPAPANVTETELFMKHAVDVVAVPGFGVVDTEEEFFKLFGIKDSLSVKEVVNTLNDPQVKALNELKDGFHRMCLNAMDEQAQRFEREEEEFTLHRYNPREDRIKELKRHLAMETTKTHGYIFLLDHIKAYQEELPDISTLKPEIVNDKEMRAYINDMTQTGIINL